MAKKKKKKGGGFSAAAKRPSTPTTPPPAAKKEKEQQEQEGQEGLPVGRMAAVFGLLQLAGIALGFLWLSTLNTILLVAALWIPAVIWGFRGQVPWVKMTVAVLFVLSVPVLSVTARAFVAMVSGPAKIKAELVTRPMSIKEWAGLAPTRYLPLSKVGKKKVRYILVLLPHDGEVALEPLTHKLRTEGMYVFPAYDRINLECAAPARWKEVRDTFASQRDVTLHKKATFVQLAAHFDRKRIITSLLLFGLLPWMFFYFLWSWRFRKKMVEEEGKK